MNPLLRDELAQLLRESGQPERPDAPPFERSGQARASAVAWMLAAFFLPAVFMALTGTPWALGAWIAAWGVFMAMSAHQVVP